MNLELIDSIDTAGNLLVDLPCGVSDVPIAGVFEDRRYELVLRGLTASGNYYVKIGEERLSLEPRFYRTEVDFPLGMYFESAFGVTDLSVWQELDGRKDECLATVRLFVIPTKIGEANYRTMVTDLQKVCRALIIDIIGKSRHSQRSIERRGGMFFRSHEEELRVVGWSFNRLNPIIEEIKQSPKSAVCLKYSLCSPGRSHSRRAIATMMKHGVDPRGTNAARKCMIGRPSETIDVAEHRLLKAFLELLKERVDLCRRGIVNDIGELEKNKKFRSRRTDAGGVSLFETEDIPRIMKLREYDIEACDLYGRINDCLSDSFWDDVSDESVSLPDGIQFSDNVYYLRAMAIIVHFLHDDELLGGVTGSNFMTKKSSRMYEQWVLIQIVTAFEKCGLAIQTWHDVVRDCIGRQFGLDFQRGTLFRARIDGDYSVSIRYEPWIHPKSKVMDDGNETLCHVGLEDVHWSPDVMIELIRDGAEPCTIYAIALDAKYTRKPIDEMYSSVRKYQRIRSVRGKKQVTRQVWLVYPGTPDDIDQIRPEEETFRFDPSGGMMNDENERLQSTELVMGDIVACPGDTEGAFDECNGNRIRLREVFLDFANGTLNFLRKIAEDDRGKI